jgi:hypothetical protein
MGFSGGTELVPLIIVLALAVAFIYKAVCRLVSRGSFAKEEQELLAKEGRKALPRGRTIAASVIFHVTKHRVEDTIEELESMRKIWSEAVKAPKFFELIILVPSNLEYEKDILTEKYPDCQVARGFGPLHIKSFFVAAVRAHGQLIIDSTIDKSEISKILKAKSEDSIFVFAPDAVVPHLGFQIDTAYIVGAAKQTAVSLANELRVERFGIAAEIRNFCVNREKSQVRVKLDKEPEIPCSLAFWTANALGSAMVNFTNSRIANGAKN